MVEALLITSISLEEKVLKSVYEILFFIESNNRFRGMKFCEKNARFFPQVSAHKTEEFR